MKSFIEDLDFIYLVYVPAKMGAITRALSTLIFLRKSVITLSYLSEEGGQSFSECCPELKAAPIGTKSRQAPKFSGRMWRIGL